MQTPLNQAIDYISWIIRIIAVIAVLWTGAKIISILVSNSRGSEEGEAAKPINKFVTIIVGIILAVILTELIAKFIRN